MSEKFVIKIAIAAGLTLFICQILHIEESFYAVIGAIIVMNNTPISTWQAGLQRMLGTSIGIVTGAFFADELGDSPIALSLSVMVTMLLAYYSGFKDAMRISGYVAAIVITSHNPIEGNNPWIYGLLRFIATAIGIVVALLVNAFLFPFKAIDKLRDNISQTLLYYGQLHQLVFQSYIRGEYYQDRIEEIKNNIVPQIREAKTLWPQTHQELSNTNKPFDHSLEFLIRRIWEHILTMDHIALQGKKDHLYKELEPELKQLADNISLVFFNLSDAIANKKKAIPLPDLQASLDLCLNKLEQIKDTEETNYCTGEILRFSTFFYALEEIVQKLIKIADDL